MMSAEDDAAAARITAKNCLESYAYNLWNPLTELETAVNETIQWLDVLQVRSIEEYNERQKVLEAVANPIMQKLYSQACATGGFPGGGPSAKSHETYNAL